MAPSPLMDSTMQPVRFHVSFPKNGVNLTKKEIQLDEGNLEGKPTLSNNLFLCVEGKYPFRYNDPTQPSAPLLFCFGVGYIQRSPSSQCSFWPSLALVHLPRLSNQRHHSHRITRLGFGRHEWK